MITGKRLLSLIAIVYMIVLPLAVSSSFAQQVFSYQGYATDNGSALQNTHSLMLSIYNVSVGGTAIYQETQNAVPFAGGLFNVLIGSNTANPLPIFDAGDYGGLRPAPKYFLGISIDGNPELAPRTELGAAQTASSSRFADTTRIAGTAAIALGVSPNASGVVTSLNTLSGPVTLSGSGSTTVSSNGQTITISSSGGAGGTGIQGVQNTDGTISITSPNGPTATISANLSNVQSRVTGTAPAGSFITGINQDGSVISAAPSTSGVGGTGTGGTIPVWTGTSTQGNSLLTDNGTTLSYSGSHINMTALQTNNVTRIDNGGNAALTALAFSGSLTSHVVTTNSSSYTVSASDFIVISTYSDASITLPATATAGRILIIKTTSAGVASSLMGNGNKIEGQTYLLHFLLFNSSVDPSAVILVGDGTNWWIVSAT